MARTPTRERHDLADARVVPHSTDAERATIGSLLIDPQAIYKVIDVVSADDFYVPAHATIFAAIEELLNRSHPIDVVSVSGVLKDRKELESVGGATYLAELTNYVATASHVAHYAEIVRQKKVLRSLLSVSAQITEDALGEGAEDVDELMVEIERRIMNIAQHSVTQNFVPIGTELASAFERIEYLREHKGELRGVTTGFDELNKTLSGLQKSNLVILGARPSMGKTSLALDIARHAALAGTPVGVFSLEMSREEVVDRLVAAAGDASLWQLRTGNIRDEYELGMVKEGLAKLANAPIYIDDTPAPTILQMRAMARRLQMQHGLGLLVVDYLQLISPRRSSDNMVQQVTEISRGLKLIARELQIPVLALSQLSRGVDQRENRTPQLHDLRESGSIEQDADVVMFIYRKERDMKIQGKKDEEIPEDVRNKADIVIAKHRNGPTKTVPIMWNPDSASFRDLDRTHEAPGDFF
jgi:replicative DNA helicase